MQQTKPYWYLLAAFGVTSAFVGAACTVNSSTDSGGAAGDDTAGSTSAGSTSAGSTSAGAAGVGEGGAAGGTGGSTAGTGGASAGAGGVDPTTVPACDPEDGGPPPSTPAATCDPGSTDPCLTCIQTHCCAEYSACYGTSPGNVCGFGGPNNEGEFVCYQTCLQKVFSDNGSIGEDDRQTCAGNCITSTTSMGALDCSTLGSSTNALIACLALDTSNCNTACYGG